MLTILSILFAFGITIFILPSIISFLINKGVGDKIDERRMHSVFTPTAGGIGVIIPFLITISIFSTLIGSFDLLLIGFCITVVFITGFLDDLFDLKAILKLFALVVPATLLMFFSEIKINSFYGLFGIYELPALASYTLTLLVIVFLTNAFNLIDGIDGLLGVISSFIFMTFGVWFFLIGDYPHALISLAMLGATAGFLVFNWHPAKIFLGDTGSLSIGFTIAILAITFLKTNQALEYGHNYKIFSPVSLIIALLIFPIFDTFRVFSLRIANKQSPFSADNRHIHHYFHRLNFKPNKISLLLLAFNIFVFTLILVTNRIPDHLLLSFLIILLVFCSVAMYLYRTTHFETSKQKANQEQKVEVN